MTKVVSTPYDDVFRTIVVDQSKLVIPVINEIFGEHYTGEEQIIFGMNEHFMNAQDGQEDKRVTDSSFEIVGKVRKKYLMECQSNADSSMVVRIFEYATQVALDEGSLDKNGLTVEIPNCAVLFLRATKQTTDVMQIRLLTPGGEVSFDVKIMKTQKYTLDEIFDKKLLFLIPFYIFVYDRKLAEYNTSEVKLEQLKSEYLKIMEYLDRLYDQGEITALTRKTIVEMSEKVTNHLAKQYKRVREGVRDIMGGKVLEYEAKTIYRSGVNEGRQEGRSEGRELEIFESVQDGDYGINRGAEKLHMAVEAFIQKMSNAGYKVPGKL